MGRVAAELRRCAGQPIRGAEIFAVLLNATQYGIKDALPPPDLPLRDYEASARRGMAAWVQSLARLPADDVAKFRLTSPNSRGQAFSWENGRPNADGDTEPDIQFKKVSEYWETLSDALIRLCKPDISVPAAQTGEARELETMLRAQSGKQLAEYFGAGADRERLRDAQFGDAEAGYLLPIGSVSCTFALVVADKQDHGHIVLPLVTTEAHRDTGEPSVNGLIMPLPSAELDRISEICERVRDPHIRVSRVIDFAGLARMEIRQLPVHYLVVQYHDWVWATPAVLGFDAFANEEQQRRFARLASRRLGAERGTGLHIPD